MFRLFGLLVLAAISLPISSNSLLAQEEKPSVAATPLKGPLYLLQGRGGNVVASVGADGVMLVDDDYAELTGAYSKVVNALAKTETAPRLVLNTHWHSDHTGGNTYWGQQGAVIVAHHNVRGRMSTRQEVAALGMVVESAPPVALPMVTYGTSMALHFNGTDIEVQHYPGGHTDGDSVVFFVQENILATGDLFFKNKFPFVDVSTGGNALRYMNNVALLLQRVDDQTLIIPGHGTVATRVDLERFHLMLSRNIDTVQSALKQGKTVGQVIEQGLGDEWGPWGTGFVSEASWIRSIAASVE